MRWAASGGPCSSCAGSSTEPDWPDSPVTTACRPLPPIGTCTKGWPSWQPPDLDTALRRAKEAVLTHLNLNGTVVPTDRVAAVGPYGRRPVVVREAPASWRERAGHFYPRRLAALGLAGPFGARARHHLCPPSRPDRHPERPRRRAGRPDPGRPRLRERRRRLSPPGQEARGRHTDRGPADRQQGHPGCPRRVRTRQLSAQDHLQSSAPGQPRPQPHHEDRRRSPRPAPTRVWPSHLDDHPTS